MPRVTATRSAARLQKAQRQLESRLQNSKHNQVRSQPKAKHGRSKERRSEARVLTLVLVLGSVGSHPSPVGGEYGTGHRKSPQLAAALVGLPIPRGGPSQAGLLRCPTGHPGARPQRVGRGPVPAGRPADRRAHHRLPVGDQKSQGTGHRLALCQPL